MNTWKVILATIAIFAAGMVAGGFIGKRQPPVAVDTKPTVKEGANRFRPDSRHVREFLKKARKELDLTEDQQSKIEEIVRASQQRSRAVWEEFAPRLHEEFKATQEEICGVLTPDQRERFRELMKQRRPPKSDKNSELDQPRDKPAKDQRGEVQHPPQANDCLPCPAVPRCSV